MLKENILCICLLILVFSLAGCASTPSSAVKPPEPQTVAPPGVEEPKAELIKVSELTIKPGYNNKANEILGTATNNNKKECNFNFEVIFINPDGTPLTVETVNVTDIKPGETKYFKGVVIDTDVSKATHKVQFGSFFEQNKN